jgi:CrcB protein
LTWSLVGWVALGGALGATLRALVAMWLASSSLRGEFPWSTFLVNALGTAILAVLAALATSGRAVQGDLQLFVGTGFCGALTTFSTFSVELVLLIRAGAVGTAVAYGSASLVSGLAIVLVVFRLVRF